MSWSERMNFTIEHIENGLNEVRAQLSRLSGYYKRTIKKQRGFI